MSRSDLLDRWEDIVRCLIVPGNQIELTTIRKSQRDPRVALEKSLLILRINLRVHDLTSLDCRNCHLISQNGAAERVCRLIVACNDFVLLTRLTHQDDASVSRTGSSLVRTDSKVSDLSRLKERRGHLVGDRG